MLITIQGAVYLHTKVYRILGHFKLILTNFEVQNFMLVFEHLMFIALYPTFQSFKVILHSSFILIQLSHIIQLMALTGIIIIHGDIEYSQ